MNEMLRCNLRQNLQVVVQIATKYSELLQPYSLIQLFESYKTYEGILSFIKLVFKNLLFIYF